MNPIKRVLIIFNPEKPLAQPYAARTEEILREAGIETRICPHQRQPDTNPNLALAADGCDAVVVLGGDGTILGVVRNLAATPIPLLGINLGGFGFLTSSAQHEFEESLHCLIEQRWQIQNRYLLEARIVRTEDSRSTTIFQSLALNEAVVTRSQPGRLLELWVGEDRDSALAYRADGLIVATATGSTGHSLSAGGPILEPNLAAIVITPISPHSLFNRPLVFGGEKEQHIWFQTHSDELILILDGQIRTNLNFSDQVVIRRSTQTFPTISMPGRTFPQVLRYKFNLRGTP